VRADWHKSESIWQAATAAFIASSLPAAAPEALNWNALDCGHFLQEESPDDVLAELRQLLNERPETLVLVSIGNFGINR
jgi:pimeloyl-ACP methyl ester carboxylesterase